MTGRPGVPRGRAPIVALLFALALVVALAPARAFAADVPPSTGIAADRFVPGLGPVALLGGEGAEVTPFARLTAAASLGWLHDPVRITNALTGELVSRPVRDQLGLTVGLEAGLWKRLAFGVIVPAVLYADGDRLAGATDDEQPLGRAAAGDLGLRLKAALVGDPLADGVHLAALLQLTVPLGGQHDFAATSGVTVEPRLVGDLRRGRVLVAVQLGARFEPARQLFRTTFGDELTWLGGAAVEVVRRDLVRLALLGEFAGEVGPSVGTRPVEARGGARLSLGPVSLDLGAGAGLDRDVGAPSWRVFLVARHMFRLR